MHYNRSIGELHHLRVARVQVTEGNKIEEKEDFSIKWKNRENNITNTNMKPDKKTLEPIDHGLPENSDESEAKEENEFIATLGDIFNPDRNKFDNKRYKSISCHFN